MNLTRLKTGALIFVVCFTIMSGCSSEPKSDSKIDRPIVAQDYKLSSDRKAFEEVRQQIPEEKRNQNDELAFMMQLMGEVKRPPADIRDKFYSAVTKKREKFNKDLDKKREEYVRKERISREEFTKELENNRKEFSTQKATSDQRRSFYESQDQKRKDYYSNQREKRDEFEADVRDQRKNFDDYIREKTSEFTQEHRAYTKKYDDWIKEQKQQKEEKEKKENQIKQNANSVQMPKQQTQGKNQKLDIEKDFEDIDKKKAQSLGTDDQ